MADLRKLSLVLAVLALVAVTAVPAQAQFSCTAAQGQQPPIIRSGGLAELVGDVFMTCSGGTPGSNVTANFQVFMGSTVTNQLESSSTLLTVSAALVVNEASTPVVIHGILQPNLLTGDVPSTRNSILFPNVQLALGTTSTVRITNIRVVAPPTVASSLIQTPVQEFISVASLTPNVTISIPNATQTVAIVLPGLQFGATTCNGVTALSALTFQQCVAQPSPAGKAQFSVKFKEGFSTAFKTIGVVGGVREANPGGGGEEAGTSWPPDTGALVIDEPSQGTRLMLRFNNLPTGVKVFVSTASLQGMADSTGASADAAAVLVSGADSDGAGGELGTIPEEPDNLCASGTADGELVEVTSDGFAVWEIVSSTPNIDTLYFAVQVKYTPNTSIGVPGTTENAPASISGGFAPLSTVNYATTDDPIPRFLDQPASATVFNIVRCVTNLLFPFVSNQAGFDTGLAIMNTSLDNSTGSSGTPANQPFNTSTQRGACTLYYFGAMGNGGSLPAPQATPVVEPGQMVTALISLGGVSGATTSAETFQGYIIAKCEFQYAHGYAYLTDRNVPSTGSSSYLALILPDRARVPDPFSTAGSGSGEQLVQ